MGCGSSDESAPVVPFSPPTSSAMTPMGAGNSAMAGAMAADGEPETPPAPQAGSGSEDPTSGVTGALDGSAGAPPGASPAATSADPTAEPLPEQPAPETPPMPPVPTTLSTVSTGCGNANAPRSRSRCHPGMTRQHRPPSSSPFMGATRPTSSCARRTPRTSRRSSGAVRSWPT
jgi:hypothetical protein